MHKATLRSNGATIRGGTYSKLDQYEHYDLARINKAELLKWSTITNPRQHRNAKQRRTLSFVSRRHTAVAAGRIETIALLKSNRAGVKQQNTAQHSQVGG